MRIQFSILLLLLSTASYAQNQYLIKYDAVNMKSNYYRIDRDTTRVKNVDLKNNSRIILRIENFNPFYWNARVTSYKKPVEEEVNYTSAFNPISVLGQGLGDFLGTFTKMDLPQSKGSGTDANSRFLNTVSAYNREYQKVQQLSEKYDQLKIVKLQLQELKFDITKTEEQIKTEAKELVKSVLETDNLNVMNTINIGKQMSNDFSQSVDELNRLNRQMQQQMQNVDASSRIEGQTFGEIAQRVNNGHVALSRVAAIQQQNPQMMMNETLEVGNLYREISTASFNFMYAINSEPDLSHLKLEMYPKATASTDTMVQFFQLNARRSLKIRNSVGAAFTYFPENNAAYFIGSDSIIRRSDKDLFTPLISTFIHFYSGNTSGFKWGGAFGVGIPLTGEKKEINFLLGLTTAFGQNEPIMLSFGVSGAKVNKLTNGNEVGSKTSEWNVDRLTTSGYGVGGFVSLTFNLSSLGKK